MLNPKVFNDQLTLKKLVDTMEDRFEYIGGKIYMMAPSPNPMHQRIAFKMGFMIESYIIQNKLGCKVFTAPIDTYLLNDTNYVQPDVSIVCDRSKLGNNGVHGAPDLVVEVISPSTKGKDEEEKLRLYRKAGVKEYWIIDYEEDRIKVYNLTDNSYWGGSFSDTIESKLFRGLKFDFSAIKEDIDWV